MALKRAQAASVSIRAIFVMGDKRHGGGSTGPINQTFGKSHHRYVHGLRTKKVIAMRKLLWKMDKSLKDLSQQI